MLTIYHNPRCSKSRQTLEIVEESGIEPTIIKYLEDTPSAERICQLADLLRVPVSDLLRRGEEDFRNASDLPDLNDNRALAVWIEQHPKTLQRPIVVDAASTRAVIGRPPENVLELLNQ
jgi:arsenate reductase